MSAVSPANALVAIDVMLLLLRALKVSAAQESVSIFDLSVWDPHLQIIQRRQPCKRAVGDRRDLVVEELPESERYVRVCVDICLISDDADSEIVSAPQRLTISSATSALQMCWWRST